MIQVLAQPKMRFSEFENSYKSSPIASLSKVYDGTHQTPKYVTEGIPFYSVEHVTRNNFANTKFISESVFEKESKRVALEKGDILMSRIGDVGTIKYIDWNVKASFYVSLALFKCAKEINAEYFSHNLSAPPFQKELWSRMIHVAFPKKINLGEISNCDINYPVNLREQQKIASFLTSVDSKISQLTEKHRLLKEYKKGVMQQIFSQQLRFKDDDGKAFPEWEEKQFGDVVTWVRTNSLSRDKLTMDIGDIQNIHYGDIHTKFNGQFRQPLESVPYVISTEEQKIKNQADYCKQGDLVIADASEDYADIGKSIEIIEARPNSLVAGLHTYIARPNNIYASGFIGYLFQYDGIRKQIKKLAQGISVLGISKKYLEIVIMQIPGYNEQQKIAQFLQSIDKKIDAVAQQVEQTKQFKKGLLQQMFV